MEDLYADDTEGDAGFITEAVRAENGFDDDARAYLD